MKMTLVELLCINVDIYKELADDIDLVAVENEFASIHDHSQYFGKFVKSDFI